MVDSIGISKEDKGTSACEKGFPGDLGLRQELRDRLYDKFKIKVLDNNHPDIIFAFSQGGRENIEKALFASFLLGAEVWYGKN